MRQYLKRHLLARLSMALLVLVAAGITWAQQAQLEGRWEGTVDTEAGQMQSAATFKKEGASYTGSITGLMGGPDAPLKELKVEGTKITARALFDGLVINFTFFLQGDTLKGEGELCATEDKEKELNFCGQFAPNSKYDMKRVETKTPR